MAATSNLPATLGNRLWRKQLHDEPPHTRPAQEVDHIMTFDDGPLVTFMRSIQIVVIKDTKSANLLCQIS